MNPGIGCLLLFTACSLLSGCDSSAGSAPLTTKPVDGNGDSRSATDELVPESDTEQPDAEELAEIKPADKSAIIEFTRRNRPADAGEAVYESGIAGVDEASLTPVQAAAVAQAKVTLAKFLGLAAVDNADLISVATQQWSDSSLGCGAAGEMAAQVITDGHKVVLVLAGLRHQVHVTRRGGRVCERTQGMLQPPRRSIRRSLLPQLQQQAIATLAAERGVPAEEITLGRIEVASWPDASMGCPESSVSYAQVPVNGYLMPLRLDGETVLFRTDGRTLKKCDSRSKPVISDR